MLAGLTGTKQVMAESAAFLATTNKALYTYDTNAPILNLVSDLCVCVCVCVCMRERERKRGCGEGRGGVRKRERERTLYTYPHPTPD